MGFKETIKEKIDEGKEKFKKTKIYGFYREHEGLVKAGGAALGVLTIGAISGAKQYAKGVRKGYDEGLKENALKQRDKNVMNITLNYIEDAGDEGATFETETGRKITFKKVSEIREI